MMIDPMDIKIGRNIRALRLLHGLTQRDVADALTVTYQQIQKYENGKTRIAAAQLAQLQKLYNVPYHFFFEGSTQKNTPAPTMPADAVAMKAYRQISTLSDPRLKNKIEKIVGILCAP